MARAIDAIQAWQRAHHAAVDGGQPQIAVRAAARLAMILALKGETAVASGWLADGERRLQELGEDVVESGYLLIGRMFERVGVWDLEGAASLPEQIIQCGRRHGDANLVAMGLNQQGRVTTVFGEVEQGVRLLDEGMIGVVSGEADDPLTAGEIYCSMIEACEWISDWGRAAQWTRALTQWCEAQDGLVAFTGQCAVHRAQLLRFSGAFRHALEELEQAVERYETMHNYAAIALAHTERGDILRHLGNFAGAERAYADAVASGGDAQPGRALLSLRRGDVDDAKAMTQRVLDVTHGPLFRHRVIPACVEVLLAAGEVDAAAALAEEYGAIAKVLGSEAVHATAGILSAQVDIAKGEPASALTAAKTTLQHWLRLNAAYEAARARVLLGQVLHLVGDDDGAVVEWQTALAAFETQDAIWDARNTAEMLGVHIRPRGLTEREIEVLRLVAAGRSNAQIAGELHLSIKTVASHLSNIFAKLDVSSRTQAAAVAHQHGLV